MSTPAHQARRYSRVYPLDRFDKHLSLKPPFGLVVCLVILCRDLLFALASAGSSLKGTGVDLSMLAAHEHRMFFFVGLVPAVLVFWSYVRRVPAAGAAARWVWKRGAQLLAVAALIQSVPAIQALWRGEGFNADFYESPWILMITAAMVLYLFLSRQVRDAFSDFPEG